MRRATVFLIAALAGLVAASGAFAADMPVRYKAPPPAPPPPVYYWTGFYVGGYLGGAFPEHQNSVHGVVFDADSSFLGGGTLGYNYQFAGSPFVVGIEGEIGYLSLDGSQVDPNAPAYTAHARVGDWYAVLAGRLGWLVTPEWLLYVKGGVTWADTSADWLGPASTASGSDTPAGWAVGGGVEWMFAQQWSGKLEYLYLDLDPSISACGGLCFTSSLVDVHTVKVGVNYHF